MICFTLVTGPMFAGKTTHLGRMLQKAKMTGQRIALIRPAADTRARRAITFARPVLRIHPAADDPAAIAALLADTPMIGIDETQFIAGWVADFLPALAKTSRRDEVQVMAAGLDLKADGTLWPGMDQLAERADKVLKLTARCAICGAPATMTLSTKAQSGSGIRLGDAGYQPVCRPCWGQAQARKAVA